MHFQDLKFQEQDFQNQDIASLPDRVTGQAQMLKARFDNVGKNLLALGKFNDLCDALDASVTQTLGMAKDKVPSEFAVTNAMINAGQGDMLRSLYDPRGMQQDIFAYAAPAAHTHGQEQVQGLETALMAKADTAHTHAPTDLADPVPILKGGTGAGSRKDALQHLAYFGADPIGSEQEDTREAWTALGTGFCHFTKFTLKQQPSAWCTVFNITYGTSVIQFLKVPSGGSLWFRDGNANGWNNQWTMMYDASAGIIYRATQPGAVKGRIWLKPIE